MLNVRITEAQSLELERRSGGNVSDYVRQQLFGQDRSLETILHRLEDIADDLADSSGKSDGESGSEGDIPASAIMPMLAELLFMMRWTVKPDTREKSQKEIERLGMKVWET